MRYLWQTIRLALALHLVALANAITGRAVPFFHVLVDSIEAERTIRQAERETSVPPKQDSPAQSEQQGAP